MDTVERRKAIVDAVQLHGLVRVDDLAERYAVSTVTIRNDLNILDDKGLILRTHGGAIAPEKIGFELPFNDKCRTNARIKSAIGKLAASLVNEGESIVLDSGTTTQQLAKHLQQHAGVAVMTNGLNIASELAHGANVDVMITGGTLRKKSLSFYGSQAEEAMRRYRFDKLFLGTDGLDKVAGLTTHFDREASLNRVMCEVSAEIILLTDSSKLGRKGHHFIREFGHFHTLITDNGIPTEYREQLEQLGVKVLIAEIEG